MTKGGSASIGFRDRIMIPSRMMKTVGSVATHAVLLVGIAITLVPLIWMLSTSLKQDSEVFSYPPRFIPQKILLSNYVHAWQAAPFGRYMINSVIQSIAVTLAVILVSSLAGFAFARMRFWGRNVIFLVYLGTIMIPKQVTLVPAYVIAQMFGWVDTYYGLIIPEMATTFGVFLLRQFFLTIPPSLEDAARMDGCGYLRILLTIFVPLSKPALATLGLIIFMRTWNSFMWPLLITNSNHMRTLQVGLRFFMDKESGVVWNQLMAASVITILPILIVFFLAQRQFIEGIAHTGIKE